MKIIVSSTEFCRSNMLQKIKSDRICATCRGDKIPLQRQRFSQNFSSTHKTINLIPRSFTVSVKQSEIWVRDYEAICCCDVSPQHVAATCNCRRICTWTQTRSDLSQSLQLVCSTPTPIPAGASCPAGRVTCHIATKEKLCVHWPVVC